MAGVAGLCILALGATAGCRHGDRTTSEEPPRVERMSSGDVDVTIIADPPRVRLDRDVLLTVHVEYPSDKIVQLPDLTDRVEGFVVNGSFDEEPLEAAGRTVLERHARLTPILAERYRLAPFAVQTRKQTDAEDDWNWFPTTPITFELARPQADAHADGIRTDLRPVWIYPSFKTVATGVAVALACLLALWLLWFALKHIQHRVRLHRMSPRERALEELKMLLRQDLIGKHRVKEFYLELTMIVRRYIERQHRVRAPEQTTQEFLAAAGQDPRFTPAVLERLKDFLEAADLVKFAAHRPTGTATDRAVETAQRYIETDAAESRSAKADDAIEGDTHV